MMPRVTQDLPLLPRAQEAKASAKGDLVMLLPDDSKTFVDEHDMYNIARVTSTKCVDCETFLSVSALFQPHDQLRTASNIQRQVHRYELVEPDHRQDVVLSTSRADKEAKPTKDKKIPKPTTLTALRRELAPVCESPAVRSIVCSFSNAEECANWIREHSLESKFLNFRLTVTELLQDCFVYECVDAEEGKPPRFEPVFLHACFTRPEQDKFQRVVHLQDDVPVSQSAANTGLEFDRGTIAFQHVLTQERTTLREAVRRVEKLYDSKFKEDYLTIPDYANQLKKALALVRGA